MSLIIDENLPPSWCDFLASAGFNAVHWKDIGNIGDHDEILFAHAQLKGDIILTQDLDFTRLLALRGTALPSVIQLRVACPVPQIVGSPVVRILQVYGNQLSDGCLISLEHDRHRIRLLPLQ